MYSSVLAAIKHHSGNKAEHPAVIDAKRVYTYSAFYEKIKETATALFQMDVCKGDYVIVECSQDAQYLMLDFACEMIGAVFVPVEKKAVESRVSEIFTETKAKCIIGQTDYSAIGKWYAMDTVISEDMSAKENIDKDMPDAKDVAEILYSTGTTGKPKGIVLSHGANVAVGENIMYGTQMRDDTVEIIPMPLSHSHGLRTCYANFIHGSCVVLVDGITNIGGFFRMIETYKVNAIDISPTLGKLLVKIAKKALEQYSGQLDYIELGTAVLDDELKEQLKVLFPKTRLYNFYGSTEAGRSCVYDFNTEDYSKCIGYPSRQAESMYLAGQMML